MPPKIDPETERIRKMIQEFYKFLTPAEQLERLDAAFREGGYRF